MDALVFLQRKRKAAENIDTVGVMQVAFHANADSYKKAVERWAREAEIRLRWDD